jgi:DNA-binding CsgD family transcriptional regulator
MTNTTPWRDDDALAQPGQALSDQELAHLLALANGNAPSAITAINGTSRAQQQQLESSLRAKLGAFSKAHLITRAFVLGVLLPRCLTVLLIVATLGNGAQQDAIAQRLPRRPTQTASARLMRTQRGSSAGGRRA